MTREFLKDKLSRTVVADNRENLSIQPAFYRMQFAQDRSGLEELLLAKPGILIYDQIHRQLQEWVKNNYPNKTLTASESETAISSHLGGTPESEYGVWVYYPWSEKLVHLVDEQEFIDLRTCRNQYKITREERDLLSTKKIGIIGLSVGQTIAMTLAMERICSELRLADFDTLDLGNLNRLRGGVQDLGLLKSVLAARAILEIDPFIRIRCFSEGARFDNMEEFLTGDGKLDLLVEETDSIDMKIFSRIMARKHQIPVIMDTNDRGMIDIERFDLSPDLPLLHGLIKNEDPHKLSDLSREEMIAHMAAIVGYENVSARMKISAAEIGKTITSWPQLASSVMLGGGMVADTCRRILLGQLTASGRYYVDFEEIIR